MSPDRVPPRGGMLSLLGQTPSPRVSHEDAERLRHSIAYLGDMASELKDLASRSGCATLAGLFALAEQEAAVQVAAVDAPPVSPD